MTGFSISKKTVRFTLVALMIQTGLTTVIAYGDNLGGSTGSFLAACGLTVAILAIQHLIFAYIDYSISTRFSGPDKMFHRLSAVLPVGLLLNIIALSLLYGLFPAFLPDTALLPGRLGWSMLAGGFINSILSFVREGSSNLKVWHGALAETERLSNTYQRSRILGLKGQLNPHFLFNCFNTLSGLIHENGDKAEIFLDQMTFVHRYLLRNDNELLVPAADEMKFARAYLHLATERFGGGLQVQFDIDSLDPAWQLPPLSMQAILEDIMQRNVLGKADPLRLRIYQLNGREVCIENSVHEKKNADYQEELAGITNLQEKFRLLHASAVVRKRMNGKESTILPLFHQPGTGS